MSNLLTVQSPYFFYYHGVLEQIQYYFNHQDISSVLIISFFLLIFQLIWHWHCYEKFKIGYYGGCLENHTLNSSTPALMQRDSDNKYYNITQKINQFRGPIKVKKRRNRLLIKKLKNGKKIPKHDYHWLNAKKRNLTSLVAFTLTPFSNSNFMILSAPFFTAKCSAVSVP